MANRDMIKAQQKKLGALTKNLKAANSVFPVLNKVEHMSYQNKEALEKLTTETTKKMKKLASKTKEIKEMQEMQGRHVDREFLTVSDLMQRVSKLEGGGEEGEKPSRPWSPASFGDSTSGSEGENPPENDENNSQGQPNPSSDDHEWDSEGGNGDENPEQDSFSLSESSSDEENPNSPSGNPPLHQEYASSPSGTSSKSSENDQNQDESSDDWNKGSHIVVRKDDGSYDIQSNLPQSRPRLWI